VSTPAYSFEPLRDHDKASFFCGLSELDDYLHRQAGQDAKRKVATPFVMLDANRSILGYYTLSSFSVQGSELPPDLAKKLPRYPLLPATLLGRVAVSWEHRGQKLGRLLLLDALHRSWRNTTEIASVGVVAEAIDDAARQFYLHHEFRSISDNSRKVFLAMGVLQKIFG
jgi:predicted GNAT family N-acyltransferase